MLRIVRYNLTLCLCLNIHMYDIACVIYIYIVVHDVQYVYILYIKVLLACTLVTSKNVRSWPLIRYSACAALQSTPQSIARDSLVRLEALSVRLLG